MTAKDGHNWRTKMKYRIGCLENGGLVGIAGEVSASDVSDAPYPLILSDFDEVSESEYNNAVLDFRFEDGYWQQ